MLLLCTLEYYQLVLSEVSRLYVKKLLRKTPEKMKFVWKKYNGENGLQRKAILCGVIPGKIKNIQIEILSTTNQMNITWSLGGYEFGLEIESELGKFEKTIYNDI